MLPTGSGGSQACSTLADASSRCNRPVRAVYDCAEGLDLLVCYRPLASILCAALLWLLFRAARTPQ